VDVQPIRHAVFPVALRIGAGLTLGLGRGIGGAGT